MTQKLRIVVVALVASLLSQATFAQYAANTQQVMNMDEVAEPVRDGQRAMNISRTIMFTSASIAMMGLTTGTVNTILGISGDDIDVFVLSTFIGGYLGGMVALMGLPFRWAGKANMKKSGSSLMTISSEGQNGYVTHVEAGLGLANTMSFHAARGYNFNEHLFVGGGVGCTGYLFSEPDEAYLDYVAVPVYADLRLTAGSTRVTPYMGARLGCDLNGFNLFSSIEFGTNIRSASGSQAESWWMGIKAECLGLELHTMGLTVGRSF